MGQTPNPWHLLPALLARSLYNAPVKLAPPPQKVLIVLPSWVGDAVMATPTLRAIRELYPQARITYLLRSYIRPLIDGLPWHDRLIVAQPRGKDGSNGRPRLGARLQRRGFDAAILLPNSFRTALLVTSAGIPRRIGYDRDGRGFMLTDRLLPIRCKGKYVPISAVDYYLGLARYLGAESPSKRMQLFTRPGDDARAEQLFRLAGVESDGRPLVLFNPGAANKGDAKLWPAERYAALADRLIDRHGARVVVSGSPHEREILDAVHTAARRPLIDLPTRGSDLTLVKSIVRFCSVVVTNDTGCRHIAAAMGTPVVSLFGPTDPAWTTLEFEHETIIRASDGRMESIEMEAVAEATETRLHALAAVKSAAS